MYSLFLRYAIFLAITFAGWSVALPTDPSPKPSLRPSPTFPLSAIPPTPLPPPPPPPAKTKALSIVFQKSTDEIGEGHDWLFFPGKQGESTLCHDLHDASSFPTKVGFNNDGTPPWPVGTFHFGNLFGRSCDYKNDGKDDAGMLWCKEKDGDTVQDVGISCFPDNMRTSKTTKQCTPSGMIPLLEHVAVAYCEW